MLDSSSDDGTGDMETAKEGYGRGVDGVWFTQPDGDGRTIPLGDSTGASGYG